MCVCVCVCVCKFVHTNEHLTVCKQVCTSILVQEKLSKFHMERRPRIQLLLSLL